MTVLADSLKDIPIDNIFQQLLSAALIGVGVALGQHVLL
jgi:hypothetical protein